MAQNQLTAAEQDVPVRRHYGIRAWLLSCLGIRQREAEDATQADLNEITLRAIRILSLFVMGGYAVIGLGHALILPDSTRDIMVVAAGASVFSAALVFLFVHAGLVKAAWSNWLVQFFAVVLLANSALHMLLSGESHQAVHIGLIIASFGLFHLSLAHFWLSYALAIGTWIVLLQPTLPPQLAFHYDFYLLVSTIVALTALVLRRRAHCATIRAEKVAVIREQKIKQTMERVRIAEVVADHERAKQEFISNMSHELRTPLNAIIGFSEMLQQEMFGPVGSDQNKDYVNEIHNSGQKLLTHLNDLLDLSSISLVDDIDDSRTFDLGDVIERSVNIARARQHRPLVKVRVNEPTNPIILYAEQRHVMAAMVHLVSNAIKFNHAEGRVDIMFGVTEGDEAFISIADTGRGMTREQQQQALEPFWQHEGTMSRSYDGIGLGLAITSEMAKRLDGRLAFKSEPGCGTTVTLTLPPDVLAGRARSDDKSGITPLSDPRRDDRAIA